MPKWLFRPEWQEEGFVRKWDAQLAAWQVYRHDPVEPPHAFPEYTEGGFVANFSFLYILVAMKIEQLKLIDRAL
jgi:hypothetical protein